MNLDKTNDRYKAAYCKFPSQHVPVCLKLIKVDEGMDKSTVSPFICLSVALHLKLCSHCRSDQLDHPDYPNSQTKLDHCSVVVWF